MTGRARAEHPLPVPDGAWLLAVPLVVPGKRENGPLTSNDRMHYRVKAAYVRRIREAVTWAAKAAKIPPQQHVTVQLHYAPGDGRRRDAPNLVATQKPAVDALVDAGVVPDDTARWVTELMPELHGPDGEMFQRRALWLVVEATEVLT